MKTALKQRCRLVIWVSGRVAEQVPVLFGWGRSFCEDSECIKSAVTVSAVADARCEDSTEDQTKWPALLSAVI